MTARGDKSRKTDRVFVLKIKDGTKALSSTGLVDPRIFTGDNKLHAVMDPTNCLWILKYEYGGLPNALKHTFTNFPTLLTHVTRYLESRNIEIENILD